VPQQTHRAITAEKSERVRLVVGLIVLNGDDLQHGVLSSESDE
jgi:hypothetical protein